MSTAGKMMHTPGPWRHEPDEPAYMCIAAGPVDEYGHPEKWIVGGCGCCGSPYGVDDPTESLANARLIAAAPDLLGALKYVRRFLNPEDHDVAYVDCVIDTATGHPAAIAKAEGRTNA